MKTLKEEIKRAIESNTKYWQPYGEKDSCFIIEEKEPFSWRINPRWTNEVGDKILALIKKRLPKKKKKYFYGLTDRLLTGEKGKLEKLIDLKRNSYNQTLKEIKDLLK